MRDSFLGSPWLWGAVCLAAGMYIPVLELEGLRSNWTTSCISDAAPSDYPPPLEAVNNCADKGLKLIPIGQELAQNGANPPTMGPSVRKVNELRSSWTTQCIRAATLRDYPSPPEPVSDCTEKGLKLIPPGNGLLQNGKILPAIGVSLDSPSTFNSQGSSKP
jgi:hypothetical protein